MPFEISGSGKINTWIRVAIDANLKNYVITNAPLSQSQVTGTPPNSS